MSPGTSIGVYEVTAPIGEGGMGQVPDGRFEMLRAEPGGAPFHVIRHWADRLKGK